MSKTNAFETAWNDLVFTDVDLAGIGDATGLQGDPASAGNLYIALYTVAPTESTQGTECTYGDYARVAVARTLAAWTTSGASVTNDSAIQFPICASGVETATHVGICSESTGGTLLYYKQLDASLSISTGVRPEFIASALVVTED